MKIFISYSREDAGDFARHVHRYLMNLGHDVFIDVNSITVGDPWASSIENNISNCDVFLVILTPDSLGSTHVENEVLQAQRENKIIVPCKSEDITYNDIKWGLDKIQGLEFTNEYQLTRKLYSKIRNFEYKIPIDTNEKTMPKNDIQKDTKIQDNIYTNSVQWYLNKAKVFERLKQYQRALSNYNEAIKINPNNFEAHFNKALLLYKIGKLEKAYESIEKAIDLQPENADIWYHKGLILEKLERYDEALEAFNTDLQIDHTDIKSLSAKADILFKLERYKEALVAFDEIIRLDPDNKDTKRNKEGVIKKLKNQEYSSLQKEIEYKFQNKDYSNVIELCDKAIDIDKDNYKPYLYKANSLLKLSRYQEAIEYYDKVLAVDVNNKDAIENKHTALQVLRIEKVKNSYENKDYSRVIELCNEIKESDTDPILQKYKGDAFYMLGNYNPALQCYDKVLEIEPKNVYAFNKRRLVREQLYKQEPKAIKLVFEKAWSIEIEPQYISY